MVRHNSQLLGSKTCTLYQITSHKILTLYGVYLSTKILEL